MSQKAKVVLVKDKQGEAYFFYCPGCKSMHLVPINYVPEYSKRNGKLKPTWIFNGNLEKPSFKPNFSVVWRGHEPPLRCHCIIRDGEIIYLVDSTHELSGSRVKMREEE